MKEQSGFVLIMAGGTGGHIYPGLAVASALREAGVGVRWLGASGGMEIQKVTSHAIALDEVRISGLRGKGIRGWLSLPFKLFRAVRDAMRSMRANKPACALSFGGYVAGPGGIAARLKGVPLIVHEQNRIPGLTNRSLARVAKQVLQAFEGTFPAAIGAVTTGNPVRASVASLDSPSRRWEERHGPPRLLVSGGSQGARALNELLPAALARLTPALVPEVRHQSGVAEVDVTRERYRTAAIEAEVTPFIDDMAEAYAWADLVVCRAGALTVSELAAAGLGAILVPFPHAVDDHQTANARVLEHAGAAVVLQESDLDAQSLAEVLEPLLRDRRETLEMARAARTVAVTGSAQRVAEACLKWVAA